MTVGFPSLTLQLLQRLIVNFITDIHSRKQYFVLKCQSMFRWHPTVFQFVINKGPWFASCRGFDPKKKKENIHEGAQYMNPCFTQAGRAVCCLDNFHWWPDMQLIFKDLPIENSNWSEQLRSIFKTNSKTNYLCNIIANQLKHLKGLIGTFYSLYFKVVLFPYLSTATTSQVEPRPLPQYASKQTISTPMFSILLHSLDSYPPQPDLSISLSVFLSFLWRISWQI